MNELFELIAKRVDVIAFDIVEVAPPYDPTGMTGQVAARISLDLLSYVLKQKELQREKEKALISQLLFVH